MSAVRAPWAAPLVPAMPASGDVVLDVEGVTVSFDGAPVLDSVDLRVVAGEVLVLVGPNGAGKSTLLGVVTGDVEPDAGSIRLLGRPAGDWSARELAMRRGVLLQQQEVAFGFLVREVVEMGRAPWQRTDAELDDDLVVAGALRLADVEQFAERRYTSLSGGERGRAALARVLAQAGIVLLLDEPTAAMDIKHTEHVFRLARDYADAGCAVVAVVHDLGLAAAHADRVAVLDRGRIRADGPPADVLTAELLSDVYDHPVEVFPHPSTGALLIHPVRAAAPASRSESRP